MDKKKSLLNIASSIFSRVVLLFAALLVRRLLIQHIGNVANGLNYLYTSIIGMLAVAELGIGSAITYSMYKPIVDGETEKTAALYDLYKRLYRIIGCVVFCAGIVVLPFLPKLISDYENLSIDVYIPFLLTLVSVVLSYLYGAKSSLIQAHKNNYITTGILTVCRLLCYSLQIITILIWQSFTLYLVCQIIETLFSWLLTEIVVRKKHGEVIENKRTIDETTKVEVVKNIKAMFMHKIGMVLVNAVDGFIISAFIGVVVLGKYSNYTMIVGVVVSIINLFFNPLTSVVAHLYATRDVKETKRWFDYFYSFNFIIGVVFFLGYYAVIDYVVRLCFGSGLEVSRSIAFIITLNQFSVFMRKTALLFRDASGTFYYDRWKPIGEGVCNLVLSLVFVKVFPEEYRVVGVIVATIITDLFICHIVDPYVVYKHAFHMSVKEYYLRNYTYIVLFIFSLMGLHCLMQKISSNAVGVIVNGCISAVVSLVVLGLVALVDTTFRNSVITMARVAVRELKDGK